MAEKTVIRTQYTIVLIWRRNSPTFKTVISWLEGIIILGSVERFGKETITGSNTCINWTILMYRHRRKWASLGLRSLRGAAWSTLSRYSNVVYHRAVRPAHPNNLPFARYVFALPLYPVGVGNETG